jgi:DNA-binding phage protein
MAKKMGKRIYREATAEEKERHTRIREHIQEELTDIKQRAKQQLAEAMQRGIAMQHTMSVLKAERMKKGLSLADMKERTGIERSTLSRLENHEEANPTVNTLIRYAEAVGKKMFIVFVDADDVEG